MTELDSPLCVAETGVLPQWFGISLTSMLAWNSLRTGPAVILANELTIPE